MDIGEIIGKIIVYCIGGAYPLLLIIALINMLKEGKTKEALNYLVGLIGSACILGMIVAMSFKNYALAVFFLVVMFGIMVYADH